MAIIIKVQPQEITPVFNPIITVLDSTNKTQEQHRYVVDFIVNGTAVHTEEYESNPQGYVVFDSHRILENYVSTNTPDINYSTLDFTFPEDTYCEYSITLSEKYINNLSYSAITNDGGRPRLNLTTSNPFTLSDLVYINDDTLDYYDGNWNIYATGSTYITLDGTYLSGATSGKVRLLSEPLTTYTSSTVYTGSLFTWNSAYDWRDFQSYDWTVYSGSNNQLLTTIESTTNDWNTAFELTQDSRMYLLGYNRVNNYSEFTITAYDANRNVIASGISQTNTYNIQEEFLYLGCGAWNINNSSNISGDLLSGATYYTIIPFHDFGSSQPYLFKINNDCTRFEKFQFLYLDKKGSWLPLTFNLKNRKNTSVNKTTYRKSVGDYNSTTNTWGYNLSDRSQSTLNINTNEIIRVDSDWVNETMARYIDDMIESPEVFHITEDNKMYAINILTSTYTTNTRLNDTLFNKTIEFEYSLRSPKQR